MTTQTDTTMTQNAIISQFNKNYHLEGTEILKSQLQAQIDSNMTYTEMAKYWGVNQFYLWNIVNTLNYQPPIKVCHKLGLQVYLPAPVCPIHNVVHDGICPDDPERKVIKKRTPKPKRPSWRGELGAIIAARLDADELYGEMEY